MFRRDSCAFYVLRFVLVLLLFWYGMQWVRGRLLPYRRFFTRSHSQTRSYSQPHFRAAPAARAPHVRRAERPGALAGN